MAKALPTFDATISTYTCVVTATGVALKSSCWELNMQEVVTWPHLTARSVVRSVGEGKGNPSYVPGRKDEPDGRDYQSSETKRQTNQRGRSCLDSGDLNRWTEVEYILYLYPQLCGRANGKS